jgi:hypothetical protein
MKLKIRTTHLCLPGAISEMRETAMEGEGVRSSRRAKKSHRRSAPPSQAEPRKSETCGQRQQKNGLCRFFAYGGAGEETCTGQRAPEYKSDQALAVLGNRVIASFATPLRCCSIAPGYTFTISLLLLVYPPMLEDSTERAILLFRNLSLELVCDIVPFTFSPVISQTPGTKVTFLFAHAGTVNPSGHCLDAIKLGEPFFLQPSISQKRTWMRYW